MRFGLQQSMKAGMNDADRLKHPALDDDSSDQGRFGFQRFGMPESGPMDWWAFRGANTPPQE